MRDVSHFDAVSGHAAVPAIGGRGPAAASRLGKIRHGARRVPTEADDARRIAARLRLALPAALFARLHLAAQTAGAFGVARVFRRLLSLQTLEPALAISHQAPVGSRRLATAG